MDVVIPGVGATGAGVVGIGATGARVRVTGEGVGVIGAEVGENGAGVRVTGEGVGVIGCEVGGNGAGVGAAGAGVVIGARVIGAGVTTGAAVSVTGRCEFGSIVGLKDGLVVGTSVGADAETMQGPFPKAYVGLQIIPGQHTLLCPAQEYVIAMHDSSSTTSPHGIQKKLL